MRPEILKSPVKAVGTRYMERRDVEAVARLFAGVFRRSHGAPGEDLKAYLEEFCFGSPAYAPETGSLVYENRQGHLLAALIGLPLRFRVGEGAVTARLLCAFMAEGRAGLRAAAALNRHFASLSYDLTFSDTAVAHSVAHWRVNGGQVLPIESLEWRRMLRPAAAVSQRIARPGVGVVRRTLGRALGPVALVGDHLLRGLRPALAAEPLADTVRVRACDARAFAAAATPLLARYRVRPDFEAEDFGWICAMAGLNTSLGPLHFALVEDGPGETVAACAWCGRPGGAASILNLPCAPGREEQVLAGLIAWFDDAGHTLVRGTARADLFEALQGLPRIGFRHRGFFCYATRNAEVREAVEHGSFYAGGLASESWSRLLTDF
jgi:hypothetical protein